MHYPKGFVRPLMALFAIALVSSASRAPAASNFDGQWSVVIITEAGNCDRAYRYPVKVMNGEMKYEGEAGITLTGRIDASGRLNATVQRGEQSATGSGRLSSSSGAGTWTGKSATTACNGRWEAEKRAG
jgi:hypothetical protein